MIPRTTVSIGIGLTVLTAVAAFALASSRSASQGRVVSSSRLAVGDRDARPAPRTAERSGYIVASS